MKTTLIAVVAAAAACVSAQSTSTRSTMTMSMPMSMPMVSSSSTSVSFTTIYEYDSCLETLSSSAVTVTNGVTQTYCPQCTHSSSGTAAAPTGPHTTVYTTAYQVFCPTGLSSAVYTITETCSDAVPHFSSGASYIPPGFTQTVSVCNVCGPSPITATLTVPCDLCAGPTPTQGASTDVGPVMPSMSTGPGAAATATVCPGPDCVCPGPSCVCPGPGCPSNSTSVASIGRASSTGPSPAQFTGGADGLARNARAALVLSGVAVGVVGVFAGLL